MKQDIKYLLIRLQDAKTSKQKRKLRKRLRLLGHEGGLDGKVIEVDAPKKLSPKKRQEVVEHNKEVSRRIESREYKPFATAGRRKQK